MHARAWPTACSSPRRENNPAGRIDSYLPKVVLAEPVERKFLKALKNSQIQALDFDAQLDEAVREGWITAVERAQLAELRAMTLDAITVDDFESWQLRGAAYYGDFGDAASRRGVRAAKPRDIAPHPWDDVVAKRSRGPDRHRRQPRTNRYSRSSVVSPEKVSSWTPPRRCRNAARSSTPGRTPPSGSSRPGRAGRR